MTISNMKKTKRTQRRVMSLRGFYILLALILVVGAVKLSRPFSAIRRQQDELARLNMTKASLAAEHEHLSAYKQQLASDAGKEAAARRQRYVKPGDRLLVFTKEKDKSKK